MGITCNNFYTNFASAPFISASMIGASNVSSNITINADLLLHGRMDATKTIFASFHLTSNQVFVTPELVPSSNMMVMDFPRTNMADMQDIPMVVPHSNVYSYSTGNITVPVSGLYAIHMQGSFSSSNSLNGIYLRFLNHSYPAARVAAQIDTGAILSTSYTAYLLGGDILQPVFYSNDSNTQLLADNHETYVAFSVLSTTSPNTSNYTRI